MADNIKDFAINWILIGLFSFSLISFAVLFPVYQGEGEIFSNDTTLNATIESLESTFETTGTLSNTNLNLTKDYDPTTSDSGADFTQIGQGFNILTFASQTKDVLKIFFYYAFGELAIILITLFGAIFFITAIYYVIKNLRTGG